MEQYIDIMIRFREFDSRHNTKSCAILLALLTHKIDLDTAWDIAHQYALNGTMPKSKLSVTYIRKMLDVVIRELKALNNSETNNTWDWRADDWTLSE